MQGIRLDADDNSGMKRRRFSLRRVFGCIMFSAMAAGQAQSFAPDYTKARNAVNAMFAILDRRPPIDSSSDQGNAMVSVPSFPIPSPFAWIQCQAGIVGR